MPAQSRLPSSLSSLASCMHKGAGWQHAAAAGRRQAPAHGRRAQRLLRGLPVEAAGEAAESAPRRLHRAAPSAPHLHKAGHSAQVGGGGSCQQSLCARSAGLDVGGVNRAAVGGAVGGCVASAVGGLRSGARTTLDLVLVKRQQQAVDGVHDCGQRGRGEPGGRGMWHVAAPALASFSLPLPPLPPPPPPVPSCPNSQRGCRSPP